MRIDIDDFVQSGVMSSRLATQCAILTFVPLSDRPIEREHLPLSEVARPKTSVHRGIRFSKQRLEQIHRIMLNPDLADKYILQFPRTAAPTECVKSLGFSRHPVFNDLMNARTWTPATSAMVWRLLQQLVYRQEIAVKYEKLDSARALNVNMDKQTKKGKQKKPIADIPTSGEQILLRNAWAHVVSKASECAYITLPSRDDGQVQLDLHSLEAELYPEALEPAVHDKDELGHQKANERIGEESLPHPKKRKLQDKHVDESAIMLAEPHAEESAEVASNRFCFKILHATAGRIKTIGTFVHQSVKAQDDVVVTLHQVYETSTADELHMQMQPHVSNVGQHAQVFIARDFIPGCCLKTLTLGVLGWSATSSPDARYSVPLSHDVSIDAVHATIDYLLKMRAIQGSVILGSGDDSTEPLRTMIQDGYVQEVGSNVTIDAAGAPETPRHGFQLTTKCLSALQLGVAFNSRRQLLEVRNHLPLASLTAFECARLLHDKGWQWRRFPRKTQALFV